MSNIDILYQDRGYNVSEKYQVIPTIDVVQRFERYGFEVTNVQAVNARARDGYQRHLVRMKSEYKMAPGLIPEVVILNSYDATKALQIRVGFFRFVCSNGIIAGNNLVPEFRITHSNSKWEESLDEFIDVYDEKYHLQKEWVENMNERKMTLDEAYHLAEQAVGQRHYDDRIKLDVVDPLELLVVRRREDRGDSAWLRFNVMQEALINGYFHKYDTDGGIRKARVLTDVSELVRVNTVLSDMFTEVLYEDAAYQST
jgi:hypothetical protein